jgi:hypothetical protein
MMDTKNFHACEIMIIIINVMTRKRTLKDMEESLFQKTKVTGNDQIIPDCN